MPASPFLRLRRILVEDLFGLYKHDIHLNLPDRVTFLHGPNGVGKTILLGMVNALLKQRFLYLSKVPFSRFTLEFDDRSALELTSPHAAAGTSQTFTVALLRHGEVLHKTPVVFTRAESIADGLDFIRPHDDRDDFSNSAWVNIRDGEVLSDDDIVSRYSKQGILPHPDDAGDDLNWLPTFLQSARVHLIEDQRLVRVDSLRRRARAYARSPSAASRVAFSVLKCQTDFKHRLDATMTDYGRRSQTLDQSFPERLLSAAHSLTPEALKEDMAHLEELTSSLKAMGILDDSPTHALPSDKLSDSDTTQLRVLSLYVQDTRYKLQALDDLANRARLFLEILNLKYRHKRLQLDRRRGFIAQSEQGNRLSLNTLSSGEQQELVLHYDLLFSVSSNTLVLIDEPELSLHVAWQKRFLPDLLSIIQLADFDAMIATHSPYIVANRDDLMVALEA